MATLLAPPVIGVDPRPQPRSSTVSGALVAGAPLPIAIVYQAYHPMGGPAAWVLWVSGCIAAMTLLSGFVIARWPRAGRAMGSTAVLGMSTLGAPRLLQAPSAALSALVGVTVVLAFVWDFGAPAASRGRFLHEHSLVDRARGAALVTIPSWLLWLFADDDPSPVGAVAIGWAAACTCALGGAWAVRSVAAHPRRVSAILVALVATAGAAFVTRSDAGSWVSWIAVCATGITAAFPRARSREIEQSGWWEPLVGHPERLFVGTFAALCVVGTFLLALPQSSGTAARLSFVDAAFTSTSAVCVTGLAVLDTPVAFGAFGQFVILLLIQVGGLGIMTFSTVALWVLGRRMSLRYEGAIAGLVSSQDRGRLMHAARRILALTAVSELVGTVVLTCAFMTRGDAFSTALWRGLFTAISAFCNAGFALQSDSLVGYQDSPLILHSVGLLIIIGGLSPVAVFALPALVRRTRTPVPAQARIALTAAALLLVGGFVFMLALEWDASLAGLGFAGKLHNAWFQSVTLRTAGFNSVDFTQIHSATLVLMLVWMFVGGSPGGTAGGIKTTTVSIFVLSVIQAVRGQASLEAFGRTIPERARARATVVVAVAVTSGVGAVLAVLLTQGMSARLAVFEVVSALGTVGLSIGGTAALDGVGKAIIIVCMFVGRVGGLTLLMFLSRRTAPPGLGRPEEEIDVG